MNSLAVRRMVREQIAGAIEADLQGDESLMKEVFEQTRTKADRYECEVEMRRIVAWLQGEP